MPNPEPHRTHNHLKAKIRGLLQRNATKDAYLDAVNQLLDHIEDLEAQLAQLQAQLRDQNQDLDHWLE